MSNAAPPAQLSLNQLRLVLVALSHRTGVHPCDANPKLALATIKTGGIEAMRATVTSAKHLELSRGTVLLTVKRADS